MSLLFLLAASCCRNGDQLQGGKGTLEAPGSLDFGSVYQGAKVQQGVTLTNSGSVPLELSLEVEGDSQLSLPSDGVTVGPGGTAQALVALNATTIGAVSGTLSISGDATAEVAITAQVIADLPCPPPGPCLQSQFDPDQGTCQTSEANDGQACDGGDPCSAQTVCSQGLCKGVAVNCDDDNVCTVDYCQPGVGCQHLDESSACNGSDPCQVYDCDPTNGCGSSSAADGTPCSAEVPCVNATVCLAGSCTGLPIPDGTPCLDPRDPCATDGACHSGECHSPTADALEPGDVLWQTVSAVYSDGDGGSTWPGGDAGLDSSLGWRAAAAVDSLGNLYLDDLQSQAPTGGSPGDFVSLDECGHERWRVPYASSTQWTNGRHILTGEVILSAGEDQTIDGQSQTTGATLWSFDPAQLAGVAAGTDFTIEDIALSESGVLYYTADWLYDDASGNRFLGRLVGGLLKNGQSKYQTQLPSLSYDGAYPSRFGYPLMVDENENLYTSVNTGDDTAKIESFDQIGNARFTLDTTRSNLNGLAENHGFFVEPVSLTAFDNQGNVVWSKTQPSTVVDANGHSPVISFDGDVTLLRNRHDLGCGDVESYGADGTLIWQTNLQQGEVGLSSHVLDTQGLIYFVTSSQRLMALEEATGAQAWVTTLPTTAPVYNGVLALTPAGSLVASVTERLFGVFAGSPMASAPWPRFRAGNDNASTPETPSTPQP